MPPAGAGWAVRFLMNGVRQADLRLDSGGDQRETPAATHASSTERIDVIDRAAAPRTCPLITPIASNMNRAGDS